MNHISKCLVIAVALMSSARAALVNIPGLNGCPDITLTISKQSSFSERQISQAMNRPSDLIDDFSRQFREERGLMWSIRAIYGLGLLEIASKPNPKPAGGSSSGPYYGQNLESSFDNKVSSGLGLGKHSFSSNQSLESSFDNKVSLGLRINENTFLMGNVEVWRGTKPVWDRENNICCYPSILIKFSWFNINIGFGSLGTHPAHAFFQQVSQGPWLENALNFPLRISVSLNVLALLS